MIWLRRGAEWSVGRLLVVLLVFGVGGVGVGCAPIPTAQPAALDTVEALRQVDAGTIHLRAGEFDQAEAAFSVAFELGQLVEALDGLGCVAFMRGDLRTAARYFRAAQEHDPTYGHALANLALVFEAAGQPEDALAAHQRALELDPSNFRARTNYAAFIAQLNGSTMEPGTDAHRQLLRARAIYPHPLIEWNAQGRYESKVETSDFDREEL